MRSATLRLLNSLSSEYGILLVLILVCGVFSAATVTTQSPEGADGGDRLAREVIARTQSGARIAIVVRGTEKDAAFADALRARLEAAGRVVVHDVRGSPADVRQALEGLSNRREAVAVIAAHPEMANKPFLENARDKYPGLGDPAVFAPSTSTWPTFLTSTNLLNIANQISVIAILAIGMTMVIVAGGVDLSVGSLMALSSVIATRFIRDAAGAEAASPAGTVLGAAVAMAVCAAVGAASGSCVAAMRMAPFIVTLSLMLIGRGAASILSQGQSIYQVPESFKWLGTGMVFGRVPYAVLLMLGLYAVAHFVMSRTVFGRHVYAVGGNAEAARLAGVPVRRVVVTVYALSGALAGLGGVVTASQFNSGSHNYGDMYELYAVAAAVVGGASLRGGEGKMIGTLLGALLIAVIQNGLNLTGVGSHPQKVVLGAVILGAVVLDQWKKSGWSVRRLVRA
jgi:ribose transport system permease protein